MSVVWLDLYKLRAEMLELSKTASAGIEVGRAMERCNIEPLCILEENELDLIGFTFATDAEAMALKLCFPQAVVRLEDELAREAEMQAQFDRWPDSLKTDDP